MSSLIQSAHGSKTKPDKPRRFSCLVSCCLRILGLWSGDFVQVDKEDIGDIENNNIPMQVLALDGNRSDVENQPLLQSVQYENQCNLKADDRGRLRMIVRKFIPALWILIPIVLLGIMVYDLIVYLAFFWGKHSNILFLVSYFTYIPHLAIIPMICVVVRAKNCFQQPFKNQPPRVLSPEYFLMRSGCLQVKDGNCCLSGAFCMDVLKFSVLLSWPVINSALVAYNYFTFEADRCTTHMVISKWAAIGGLGIYGSFSFIIYKLRESYDSEFKDIVDVVEKDSLSIDEAKARVRQAFSEFRGFRNLIGTWTTFTTAVGTLGIFMQLSWNYNVYEKDEAEEHVVLMYAVMIWSEKLQFLIQPLLVIGGVNADYLWRKFKRILTERLRSTDQTKKIDQVLHHMNRIDTSFKWVKPTVALSLLSFYLGMHLNHQNLHYWIGPHCMHNTTNGHYVPWQAITSKEWPLNN